MTDEKQTPPIQSLTAPGFVRPAAASDVTVFDTGTVSQCSVDVLGNLETDTTSVIVKAFPTGNVPSPADMTGAAEMKIDGDHFSLNGMDLGFPVAEDQLISFRAVADATGTPEVYDVNNAQVKKTNLITVQSKHCPWLRYSDNNYTGPPIIMGGNDKNVPPEEGWQFRPPVALVPVPPTLTHVKITCTTPSNKWNNNPNAANGVTPDGKGGGETIQSPYLNNYNFPPISGDPKAKLCQLIGILVFEEPTGGGSGSAGEIIKIGAGTVTVPLSNGVARAKKLLLGFHDGYEWGNNDGSQVAKVEFITGP